jgi:SlyX protein
MAESEQMSGVLDTGVEARIANLEIKLGDADDTLEALNLTVFRQQRQIEQLQQDLRALRQQVQATPSGETSSLRDEIPPHY